MANKTKKRRIVPEDLLKYHIVSDARISPDGRTVLFTKKHTGEKNDAVTNLWVVPAEGGEPRQFTAGNKDSHGRWSPDGSRIALISSREKPKTQLYTLPAAGGEAVALTRFPEGKIGTFKWSPDGTMLAVSFRETEADFTVDAKKKREETGGSLPPRVIDELFYRYDGDGYFNDRRYRLYVVDAASGEHRLLFDKDTNGLFSFDWSPDSKQLAVTANTSRDALLKPWKVDLFRVDVKSGRATKVPNLEPGEKTAVAWSPDGKRIALAGREGKEIWDVRNIRLYVCDPEAGNATDLTGHADYCLIAKTLSDSAEVTFDPQFVWSPAGDRIYMNFGWHGGTHVASVPAKGGEVVFHTSGRQSVALGNISDDGKSLALTSGNQTALAEVAVGRLDKSGGTGALKVSVLTRFNRPLFEELDLSPPEPHWITSASGNKVHVWVMKPINFRGGRHPAVLEIHGGPHTQYGEAFFHEFQVLAAAGYVVVFSNPRGSKGYGEAFCNAIKGNWGEADWEDIQAVTAFMKAQPFIDSKRMGVMGGSYGGYMTNWAIGHTRDFAAAITDRCVANLVSMAGTSDIPLVPNHYWEGNAWDKPETLWNQSPLKYFGNVETPTLIIHSEGDLRCNVEQGEQVFHALKLRGIPTRLVRYPSTTSHGMSRGGPADLRIHRLRQILEWWGRYLDG
jgi:acylaminoacyl-peptidase